MLEVSIRKSLGEFTLDATLDSPGGTLVVIGPSGAGKSMLLRAITGVLRPDAGRITLNGRNLFAGDRRLDLPANERRIGYVPQDFALFPHLTVAGNIGFGLRLLSRSDRAARVAEMLALTGLESQRNLRPAQLSGGQKQRVALARALAVRPELLLLDEPFSAVDAPTRQTLIEDVHRLLATTGTPAVLVTHDRNEAMRLADRLAVLISGRIRQIGDPSEVFSAPVDEEVAQFVGVEIIVPGVVRALEQGVALTEVAGHTIEGGSNVAPGDRVLVCLRPEDIVITPATGGVAPTSARNHIAATVARITPWGPFRRVELHAGFPLVALITRHAEEDLNLAPGTPVTATFKATAVHLVPR